jgi:hypothetical protein
MLRIIGLLTCPGPIRDVAVHQARGDALPEEAQHDRPADE